MCDEIEIKKVTLMPASQFTVENSLVDRLSEIVVAADALAKTLRRAINEQAEDDVLWAIHISGTQPISEAYLQQELRGLHAVAEEALAAFEKVRGL